MNNKFKTVIAFVLLIMVSAAVISGCGSSDPKGVLEGYSSGDFYTDDDQSYGKYVYDESFDKKFASDSSYTKVSSKNTEEIKGFIDDFNNWAVVSDFSKKYTVNDDTISPGDYYVITDELINDDTVGARKIRVSYKRYSVCYYDTETHTLHYLHNDIAM